MSLFQKFFPTNNGKIYIGTWLKSSPSGYTFEKIAPADSAKADTPIAAIMWDDSTAAGTKLAWTDTNKQARVYFYNQASTALLNELVWRASGSTNVWSTGPISGKNRDGNSVAGLDACVYFRNNRFNIKYV